MSAPTKPAANGTALILGVVAIFCFTIAAVVTVAIAIPDGGNAGSIIALLLGALASTLPALAALNKITNVETTVSELNNGRMDAKIRAAVADVIGPDQVHPAAREQIAEDRVRRDDQVPG